MLNKKHRIFTPSFVLFLCVMLLCICLRSRADGLPFSEKTGDPVSLSLSLSVPLSLFLSRNLSHCLYVCPFWLFVIIVFNLSKNGSPKRKKRGGRDIDMHHLIVVNNRLIWDYERNTRTRTWAVYLNKFPRICLTWNLTICKEDNTGNTKAPVGLIPLDLTLVCAHLT